MASYAFETITPEEALGLTAADQVRVAVGTASQTTVIYNPDQTLAVTIAGRTVVFGASLSQVSFATGFTFADGSELYVGDSAGNVKAFQDAIDGADRRGAAYGGAGDDHIRATIDGAWLMQGNQGNDTLLASGYTHNTIYGGQGDDRLSAYNQDAHEGGSFIQGNKGADTITGSLSPDTLLGGQDNDVIDGGGGQDFLNGNLGNDSLYGGGVLLGEGGDDTLTALTHVASTVRGGDGSDRLFTEGFLPSTAAVTLLGEAGNDTIQGSTPFADLLDGGAGNDTISVFAHSSAIGDTLLGGDGDDSVVAGATGDTLDGGAGADTLYGNTGGDVLTGGEGADVFKFGYQLPGQPVVAFRVTDWSSEDRLLTSHAPTNYTEATAASWEAALELARSTIGAQPFTPNNVGAMAIQVGADVIVFSGRSGLPVDGVITLAGRTLNDISALNVV